MRNIYDTGGTTIGFFSAVFDAYTDKRAVLVSDLLLQTQMGDEWKDCVADDDKARRVIKKLRAVDERCLYEIDRILRSSEQDKEQIAFLRKKRGFTQEDLAKALGVTNQAVSKWESGQCYPDIQLLPEIAGLFDVSVDELLREE